MQNFNFVIYGPGVPYLSVLVQKILDTFPMFKKITPEGARDMGHQSCISVLRKPEELLLFEKAIVPTVSVFLGFHPRVTCGAHLFTHRLIIDWQSMKKAQAMLSCIAFQIGNREIITIDGTSSSGKGTLAALLAQELSGDHLDTGLLYRAIAYKLGLQQALTVTDSHLAGHLAVFERDFNPNEIAQMESELRTSRVDKCASEWSQSAMVREVVFQLTMRACNTKKNYLIPDGRDMGTLVFPLANHKFFVDCPLEVRAERRAAQSAGKSMDEILLALNARDEADRNRAISPLVPAKDAIMIENTAPVRETLQLMLAKIKENKEFLV
ncbi:MAG: (d)CMP kinase [Candidatus Pacebacteria bacterium]|nr:(d)CMP kinase [Candidatus Paceibacterota bacterium]